MADDLSILLKAQLNVNESIKNINKQILEVQSKLKTMNITLDVSGVEKAFKDMDQSFNSGKKNPMGTYKRALEDTIHQFKVGIIDLETYASRMEKILYGNGSTKKRDFFKLSNSDQEKYIAKLTSAQNEVQKGLDGIANTQKSINKDKEEAIRLAEEESAKIKKLQSDALKSLNSLPKSAIGTDDTKQMFSLLNTSKSLKDVESLKSIVDDYYKECIANEKKLNSEKTNTAKDMQKAISQEENKLEYIRKQRIQILEIERQIANAKNNQGIDGKPLEGMVSQIRTELDAMSKLGMDAGKYEKGQVDDLIKSLQHRLKIEKDIVEVDNKKEEAYRKIEKQLNKINDITTKNDKYDKDTYKQLVDDLNRLRVAVEKGEVSFDEFGNGLKRCESKVDAFNVSAKQLSSTTNSFTDSLKRFTAFYGLYDLFELGKRGVTQMSEAVLELDRSILEVQKVASIPNMDNFIKQSYEAADGLKILGTSFIDGIGDASRMGYSLDEAFDMSTVANKMVIVGDGISSVEQAMGVLQSTLALFSDKGYDANNVLDLINQTANNTGVSFGELAEMISRSASVGLSGSSLESIIALNSTLFEVTRNAETSASAINMINQRIQGIDIDSGEKSVELMSKMNDELMALTGVEVYDSVNGGLKDTASVLEEVALVWNDLDKTTQSATATLIGNNRHAKAVSALMSNWDTYYKSLDESAKSAGSAQNELNAYLESTTGKVEAMKGALQELFVKTLSSDLVGNIAEATTEVIKFITSIGGIDDAIKPLAGMLIMFKGATITKFFKDTKTSILSFVDSLAVSKTGMAGYEVATKGAAVATTAFGTAVNMAIPIIGAIITVVSLLNNEMAARKAKAEEARIANVEAAKSLNKELESLESLKKEYSTSNQMADGSIEKKEALIGIQERLSEAYGIEASDIDIVNGKYDEQIAKLDELAKKKSDKANVILTQNLSDAEAELKDLINTEFVNKGSFNFDTTNINKAFEEVKKQYEGIFDSFITYSPSGRDVVNFKIDTDNPKEYYEILGDIITQMQRFGVNNGVLFDEVYSMWTSVGEAISGVEQAQKDQDNIQRDRMIAQAQEKAGITDVTNATKEQYELMKQDITSKYMSGLSMTTENAEKLSVAMSILNKMFPQFQEKATDAFEDPTEAVYDFESAIKEINGQFGDFTSGISMIDGAMEKLKSGTGLTSDEIIKLTNRFPQLRDQLVLTEEGYTINEEALASLRGETIDYENQSLTSQINSTKYALTQCQKRLGIYIVEINAINDLASAQRALEGAKSSAGNQLFGEYRPASYKEEYSTQEKEILSYVKTIEELYGKLGDIEVIDVGGIVNNKDNKKKENDSSKSVKNIYDAKIKAILAGSAEIERAMQITQQQIEMAELKGEAEKAEKLKKQLVDQQKQRRDIIHKQANELRALLSQTKNAEARESINSEIIKLQDQYHSSKIEQYEDEIEIIKEKATLEKRVFDEKIRRIELEQKIMNADSLEYQAKEQEKIDVLLSIQQGYLDTIRKLKEKGLSDENEDIREYIDLWKDAEQEILDIKIAMAEKEKKIKIDNINEQMKTLKDQESAMRDILKMQIEMYKKEYEDEKKIITQKKANYKALADARIKEIQRERDALDKSRKMEEDNAKKSELQLKINMAAKDNSEAGKMKYEELLKEMADLDKEIAQNAEDEKLDLKEQAIKDELEKFEEKCDKELDIIENNLKDQSGLREKALRELDNMSKATLDKLIEYNRQYGTGVDKDVIDKWDLAVEGMKVGGNSMAESIGLVIDKVKELGKALKNLEKSPISDFMPNTDDDTKPSSGDSWYEKKDENAKKMKANSSAWFSADDKERERLSKENEKLGKEIGAWKGSDGEWYILINGKKMKLYDSIGVRHDGLMSGRVDGLKPNERIMKLTKDEWVFTDKQFDNLNKNISGIIGNRNNQNANGNISFDKFINVEHMDNNTDIETIVDKATKKMLETLNKLNTGVGNKYKLSGLEFR